MLILTAKPLSYDIARRSSRSTCAFAWRSGTSKSWRFLPCLADLFLGSDIRVIRGFRNVYLRLLLISERRIPLSRRVPCNRFTADKINTAALA